MQTSQTQVREYLADIKIRKKKAREYYSSLGDSSLKSQEILSRVIDA